MSPRGGRRPRAGAPKGNLNAAKHLQASRDRMVRAGMRMLPRRTAEALTARLKSPYERAKAIDELAALAAEQTLEENGFVVAGELSENNQTLVAFPGQPSIHHHHHQQHNNQTDAAGEREIETIIQRLVEWDFRPGPRLWVRIHRRALPHIIYCLDLLDDMSDAELRSLDHPMKWLNGCVHMEIAEEGEEELFCPQRPYCNWQRDGRLSTSTLIETGS